MPKAGFAPTRRATDCFPPWSIESETATRILDVEQPRRLPRGQTRFGRIDAGRARTVTCTSYGTPMA